MTIEPRSLSELIEICKYHAESGFFGSVTAGQVLVLALAGRDLNLSYSQAIKAFHIIKGRPCLTADAMVAACLRSKVCEYFLPIEQTSERATWRAKRVGCDEQRYSFSMVDAQRAGIASEMYRRYPARMLSARAKTLLARDLFPDVLLGLISDDEAEEIAAHRDAPALAAQVEAPALSTQVEPALAEFDEQVNACATVDALNQLWRELARTRESMSASDLDALKKVFSARKKDLQMVQI